MISLIKNIITNKYAVVSICVLLLGFVLSILASKLLFDYNKAQQSLLIERHTESQSEQLQISITSALNSLSSISAFFRVQENIDQDRFLKFVESDAAIKTGIIALAWVPRITHAKRKQFELSLNKHLRGYRSITEMNGHGLLVPAQIRDEYFPVQHLFSNFDTELFTELIWHHNLTPVKASPLPYRLDVYLLLEEKTLHLIPSKKPLSRPISLYMTWTVIITQENMIRTN